MGGFVVAAVVGVGLEDAVRSVGIVIGDYACILLKIVCCLMS